MYCILYYIYIYLNNIIICVCVFVCVNGEMKEDAAFKRSSDMRQTLFE